MDRNGMFMDVVICLKMVFMIIVYVNGWICFNCEVMLFFFVDYFWFYMFL